MSKPLIAIVGRPNVGKSTLFNKLTGQRLSIVEDTPGVTRDRIYAPGEWCGREFMLVDTGGIEPGTNNEMLKFMRRQAEIAIETATVIIMVVDVTVGLTAADAEVASMLKRSKKPVVLAVNKCDQTGHANPDAYEFYALGLGDPIEVSAVHGHGTGDLLDECIRDAKAQGKKGLCILCAEGRKREFLADPQFLAHKGFLLAGAICFGLALFPIGPGREKGAVHVLCQTALSANIEQVFFHSPALSSSCLLYTSPSPRDCS